MNRWACGFLLALLAVSDASARVWYVDKANSGTADGTTWARAFPTIQQGINAALSGDDVWVADGSYGESRTANGGSLILRANVHVYGGFAGTETNLNQRNPAAHPSTIDGTHSRGGAKAYHVVVGATGARLDGFTIVGGNASGGSSSTDPLRFGGGLYNSGITSVTVANCTFSGLLATRGAGAVYNRNSTIRFEGCTFSGNSASYGGAVLNEVGSITFVRCVFQDNRAGLDGGAIHNDGSAPSFTACSFYGNEAGTSGAASGGAVYNPASGSSFINCVFQSNDARTYGGAIYGGENASFMNCTFRYNDAGSGASLYCRGGTWQVTNSILWDGGASEIVRSAGAVTLKFSDIEDSGYTGNGNIRVAPVFVGGSGDPPRLKPGSPGINQGTTVNAPSTDILGTPRPVGAGIDMGAYEGATCILKTSVGSAVESGSVTPAAGPSHYYLQGNPATLTATPAAQWRFNRWEEGTSSWTQNPLTLTMSQDHTVRAQFIRLYTLTVQVVGTGTVTPAPGSYTHDAGKVVQISASAPTGWQFDHWEGALTGNTTPASVTMNADRTVTAVFKRKFTLTTAAGVGGSVNPAPGPHVYTDGTSVSVSATPHTGYRFDHWEGDASGSVSPVTITMDADHSVQAVFTAITYRVLTVSKIGQGSTNPAVGSHSYEENTPVQVAATPAQNWRFDHWEGGASGSANPLSLVMDQDWDVTAVFDRIPLDVLSVTPLAALPLGGTSATLSVQSWTPNCRVDVGGTNCPIVNTTGQGTVQVRVKMPAMIQGSYPLRVTDSVTQEQADADQGFVYTANPFDTGLPAELNNGLVFDVGVTGVTTYGRRIFRPAGGGAFPAIHYVSPDGIVIDLPTAALPAAADGAFLLLRLAAQPESLFPGATPYPDTIGRSGVVDWHLFVRESGTNIHEVLTSLPQALRIGLPLSPGPQDTLVPAGFGTTLDALFDALAPDPPDYADTGSIVTVDAAHLATVQSRLYGAYVLYGERPPQDINRDGSLNASDVQLAVNAALEKDIGGLDADIDNNGYTDAYDLQSVINVVLGFW